MENSSLPKFWNLISEKNVPGVSLRCIDRDVDVDVAIDIAIFFPIRI